MVRGIMSWERQKASKKKKKNPLNVLWTANKPFSSWYFFSLFRNRSSSNSRQYVRSCPQNSKKKLWKKPLNHDVTLLWALYFCCVPGVREAPFYLFEVLGFFCSWLHPAVLGNYLDVQNQVETVEFFVLACSQESVQCIICHELIYCPKSKAQKNVNFFFFNRSLKDFNSQLPLGLKCSSSDVSGV